MLKLVREVRVLPRRKLAEVAGAHAVLLAAVLLGGVPYVWVQLMLAVEILFFSLATVALYPERGWRKHVGDILKVTAGLVFVLFFLVVTWGVAHTAGGGSAAEAGLEELNRIAGRTINWLLLYVIVQVAISWAQAIASPHPRRAWAQSIFSNGAVTFLAMFFMVFAALFVGTSLVSGLNSIGLHGNTDSVLGSRMVLLRFLLSLVAATISPSEFDAIAENPYTTCRRKAGCWALVP